MKEGVTFEKLQAEMRQLHYKAGQVRAILALCEAGYFRLLETSGPEKKKGTLEASIRGALVTSLALVGQASVNLARKIDALWLSHQPRGGVQ